jgi:hypothetical protein
MKYTHVPGRMQPWDEFHESHQGFSSKAACHKKKKLTCHHKFYNSLLSCLSCQNHFLFLNRG